MCANAWLRHSDGTTRAHWTRSATGRLPRASTRARYPRCQRSLQSTALDPLPELTGVDHQRLAVAPSGKLTVIHGPAQMAPADAASPPIHTSPGTCAGRSRCGASSASASSLIRTPRSDRADRRLPLRSSGSAAKPLPHPSAGPARRISLTRQPIMAPLLPPSLNPALQLLLTDDQTAAVTASLEVPGMGWPAAEGSY